MDIKQRLACALENEGWTVGGELSATALCRDALARIRELEGAPDIKARLQLEKAKHAKIGHRPREYAEQCDAALERIEELEARVAPSLQLERIAQALEGLAAELAADRRRL